MIQHHDATNTGSKDNTILMQHVFPYFWVEMGSKFWNLLHKNARINPFTAPRTNQWEIDICK